MAGERVELRGGRSAIVTTCRGRLESLKVALPTWLALPVSYIVVVDAGCPEGTAAWARGVSDARIRVVEMGMGGEFNLSAARNRGAAAGWEWGGEVGVFLDADILTAGAFGAEIEGVRAGVFLRCGAAETGTAGQCVVHRADFERAGGYDEAYRVYGDEDLDLYRRLRLYGVEERRFHAALIRHLPHGNETRSADRATSDLRVSKTVAGTYGMIKFDLMRVLGSEIVLEERRRIFDRVMELVRAAHTTGREQVFEYALPDSRAMGTWLGRMYRVTIRSQEGGAV